MKRVILAIIIFTSVIAYAQYPLYMPNMTFGNITVEHKLVADTIEGHSPVVFNSPVRFMFQTEDSSFYATFSLSHNADTNVTVEAGTLLTDTTLADPTDTVCVHIEADSSIAYVTTTTNFVYKKDNSGGWEVDSADAHTWEWSSEEKQVALFNKYNKGVFIDWYADGHSNDTLFILKYDMENGSIEDSIVVYSNGQYWIGITVSEDTVWAGITGHGSGEDKCIVITDTLFMNYGEEKFIIGIKKNY